MSDLHEQLTKIDGVGDVTAREIRNVVAEYQAEPLQNARDELELDRIDYARKYLDRLEVDT